VVLVVGFTHPQYFRFTKLVPAPRLAKIKKYGIPTWEKDRVSLSNCYYFYVVFV
jgi:hypothetical protein